MKKDAIIEHPIFDEMFHVSDLSKTVFEHLLDRSMPVYANELLEHLSKKGYKLRWASDVMTTLKRFWGKDNDDLPVKIEKTSKGVIFVLTRDLTQLEYCKIFKKIDLSKPITINWLKQLEKDQEIAGVKNHSIELFDFKIEKKIMKKSLK